MNCIQPIAPAELGPMLRPKFDSTLLIAASTCQRMPYAAPARCHKDKSFGYDSCCGIAGGLVQPSGKAPDSAGVDALGKATCIVAAGTTTQVPPARAVPPTAARTSAGTSR